MLHLETGSFNILPRLPENKSGPLVDPSSFIKICQRGSLLQ